MTARASHVVLVDERPERRRVTKEVMLAAGVSDTDILEASDAAGALALLTEGAGVVLLERQRPLSDYLAGIAVLRAAFPLVGIVTCSFPADAMTWELEVAAGADEHIVKPFRADDVRKMIDRRRVLGDATGSLIGHSAADDVRVG